MKKTSLIGIILIVAGVVGFAIGGISFSRDKKDSELEPLQFASKQTNIVPISPILSTLALFGGLAMLVRRNAALQTAKAK